jgi:hypothetical protein
MTTVAQLIKYLQTLPLDAEVEVMSECCGNWETYTKFEPLQIPDAYGCSDNLEVHDFRDNPFVKEGDPRFGKVYVDFGGR